MRGIVPQSKEITPVPDQITCESVLHFGDDILHCELPEDHVTPTDELPQGTPHRSSERLDSLTGDPWTWWG